jgi:ferrous-iron efflux pump FieF
LFLILQAIDRLYHPRPIAAGEFGIAVIVLSIGLTLALVAFQRSVVRRTGSLAVRGDALHYRGDLVMNLAVIAAIVLSGHFKLRYADPLFAFGIAAYLLWGAVDIFREARDHLMDREFPDEQRRRIREIAMSHPKVLAVHDLRTRFSGINRFIQLHIEMDPVMPLIEAHVASDEVEAMIRAVFADADVIIHQDPYGIEEARATFQR